MTDPNVFEPEWDMELPEFGVRASRVAHRAGGEELGATLFELETGGTASPYHVHHGNEELLIVLAGSPELRSPAGRRRLAPGAIVAFPRGERGAHQVTNPGPEPARILIVSTMNLPDVAEHLDTGAVLPITGPEQGWVFPAGTDIPFIEAVQRAIRAAPPSDAE